MWIRIAATLGLIQWLAVGLAYAEDRIALVVGNGMYQAIPALDNPNADATLIGAALEAAGFEVDLLLEADQSTMKRGIADFGRKLRAAGPDATGLFYYAGHGVQSNGNNYLLPVDSAIRDEADLDLVGVEADWVLRQLFSARIKTSIIVLDACRNNPFEGLSGQMREGLAEMNAPTGSFLSYATAPGSVALDGLSGNSPFTAALARNITVPGVPIEALFKQVRIEVLEETNNAQTPWDSSSLTGDFVFVEKPAEPEVDAGEVNLWNSVKATSDSVQVMLFLRAYPNSLYAPEARALLKTLMDAELASADAPEPVAAPEVKEPSARETELIGLAQSSGALRDYEAYLAEFPTGVFADLAHIEIAAIQESTPASEPEPAEETLSLEDAVITFLDPLTQGAPEVAGLSIEELSRGSPLFSPIEGLDAAAWEGQQCTNCHQWTKEALCDQGKFYLGLNAQRSLGKEHPYGGTFKQNLRAWAAGGCQ